MSAAPLQLGSSAASARRALAAAFRAYGLDNPNLDARVLVAHALDADHADLAAGVGGRLSAAELERIANFAMRRLAREPVARILSAKEFWSLSLQVTEDVLVPRPETETVVEAALSAIDPDARRQQPLRIADLGTGSGALLLALLKEFPNAVGVGTDRSPRALEVAWGNAVRHELSKRAAFVCCDYGAALAGGFDLVVANPPYIPTNQIDTLAPEVREHDPHLALDGGEDGLDGMRVIANDARRLLRSGGVIAVEMGLGQASSVAALFAQAGLSNPATRADLSGIARAFIARNP